MKDNSNLIIAFVAGAALGTLAGILFAPHKGTKTRRIINEEGRRVAENFRNQVDEGLEKLSGLKDDIMKAVEDSVDDYTKGSV